jgi:gluconokinase
VILGAATAVLTQVLGSPELRGVELAGVGLATYMHSLILLDADDKPLTNIITWADLRAEAEVKELKERPGASAIYAHTGCPVHPMYLPAKLMWFAKHTPHLFARARRVVSMKDYLVHRLAGAFLVDESVASASGLLNIHSLEWDEMVTEAVGLEPSMLSRVVPPLTILEGFTTPYTRAATLPAGVPLVIGASDGTLSNLGSGALLPGQFAAMIGTSAAVRVVSEHPVLDDRARTWCYYLAERNWVPGGATNNGGNILRWYRDRFGADDRLRARRRRVDPYQVLSERAAAVPPGSRGLLFLPFLAGERCPNWNASARGVLFGLNLSHGPDEMVRSIMEGTVYQLYSVFEALQDLVGTPTEVRASGGFTRSREWVQIMADVFGVPLALPRVTEGTAFGAAALAMVATGAMARVGDAQEFVTIERSVEPEAARTSLYREAYAIYQETYDRLVPEFERVVWLQKRLEEV